VKRLFYLVQFLFNFKCLHCAAFEESRNTITVGKTYTYITKSLWLRVAGGVTPPGNWFAQYNPAEPGMRDIYEFARCIAIPLALIGPTGEMLFANESFNSALGLQTDFNWREVPDEAAESLAAIDFSGYRKALNRAMATGEPQDCEIQRDMTLIQPDAVSSRNAVTGRISPLNLPGDNRHYVVALCPPVRGTQRDDAELLRIQRGENLERLASGVAHEFNNLFTGIKGMTDLIKTEVNRESEIYEFAESIKETVDRGSRLIQQLSSFARDEPYSLAPVDVGEYIQRSRPLLELQLQRGTALEVHINQSGVVMLDSGRMDHALANLLQNSRDAVGGRGLVRVLVDRRSPDQVAGDTQEADHNWIFIEVADSGAGIEHKLLNRVVEPFFTTKERGKATGLGLSTTIKIVEMHGGVMAVGNSPELGGAAIRIFLPVAESHVSAGI